MIMKPVYIVSSFNKTGTFLLRGEQVGHALRKRGHTVRFCRPSDIPRIRDSLLLFVKFCHASRAATGKQNGNMIIWDILDIGLPLTTESCAIPVDAIIYSTAKQRIDFAGQFPESVVSSLIYHHIDSRLPFHIKPELRSTSFNLAYIGLISNLGEFCDMPDMTIVSVDTANARSTSWMKRISPFNCHFAVRHSPEAMKYKPLAKVAVAAACNAGILVNQRSSALELLGEDYSYQSGPSRESIADSIRYSKESFGSRQWNEALDRMRALRERLALDVLVNEYVRLFRMLS
jgi:hypothetical protein